MHRNTVILVAILAVIAALLTGIFIGQKLSGTQELVPSPTPLVVLPSSQATPVPEPITYSNTLCGISFTYPSDFAMQEASGTATLTHKTTEQKINLLCGVEFPKPPLPPEKIETATIAGQRTTIYHDTSAKDGTSIDVVVFKHPRKRIEIAFFGFGEVFNSLLASLELQ